ncbi:MULTISPECIES: hypothetical protein [Pseudomonas]|uniref:hypothetical protein n=1 Tax=Pseudomonas TaxID=286 RepID=UPI00164871F5|nr:MULTISPECIES: hypothetical protein [Pseudomonas]QXI49530.1 hypothetical protein HU763_008855 [Pseudomonas anuradhapurensis]
MNGDDIVFFAEDLFGIQFCLHGNEVLSFDPETVKFSFLSARLEEWAAKILADYDYVTGYSLAMHGKQKMAHWSKATDWLTVVNGIGHAEKSLINAGVTHVDASRGGCLACEAMIRESSVSTDTQFTGKRSKSRK